MWPFKKKKQYVDSAIAAHQLRGIRARKLPNALRTAIAALEKDTFPYSWEKQHTCNCGVVVCAMYNITPNQTESIFSSLTGDEKLKNNTWRELVQKNCSITGMPINQILIEFSKNGLNPTDMVHLEYMNNEAILRVSGINTTVENYHEHKHNLVKYLKAWLKIISSEEKDIALGGKALLEAKLLIATSNENYEEAATLRDQIASL